MTCDYDSYKIECFEIGQGLVARQDSAGGPEARDTGWRPVVRRWKSASPGPIPMPRWRMRAARSTSSSGTRAARQLPQAELATSH